MKCLTLALTAILCTAALAVHGSLVVDGRPKSGGFDLSNYAQTGIHPYPESAGWNVTTPLDEYIARPDTTYNYTYSGQFINTTEWTCYFYIMTSLAWLKPEDSSAHIWWHQFGVIVPHNVDKAKKSALLYVTGGKNYEDKRTHFPDIADKGLLIAASIAVDARTPAAVLWQVPNQPIRFEEDPYHENRGGNAILGFTWWRFVHNTTDPEWICFFPMVKAAIRALDTLASVIPDLVPGMQGPTGFYVAGASKRGWVAWLVAATDRRVLGAIPIVLSAVNVVEFAHRQFEFYGAWTFALEPMWKMNFTQDIDEANTTLLMKNMDPWYYRSRLTMPKLAINAVGDEFQMPDDQRYWAKDMPGEMNLLMLQNAEHSCLTGVFEILQAVPAFINAIEADVPRPNYTWAIDDVSGNITVSTNVKPKQIKVWAGESGLGISEGKRDFRWAAINATVLGKCWVKVFGACIRPILWWEEKYEDLGDNTFMASMPITPGRWTGFLMEIHWANPADAKNDFIFTSPVSVVPNTRPFQDCNPQNGGCKSTLC